MRITNSMITGNYLNNLYGNLARMNKYQTQLTLNSRITKLSDDPIGVLYSMQARAKLSRIEQYQRNVDAAQTWLTHTEAAVLEMNDIIKSTYENVIGISNDYMNESDKNAAAQLIRQYRDQVLAIGNNKNGDKYIFGGFNTDSPPFDVDAATGAIRYNGLDLSDAAAPGLADERQQVIRYEIGLGMKTDVSLTGIDLMSAGDTNIYNVLDGLYNALSGNASADAIAAYADTLQNCQSNLMALEAEIGGRVNRLELVTTRYQQDFLNYSQMKANVEEIDQAEVIMYYKMAESVYTAALQVGAGIIRPSLVNFLN